MKPLAGVISVLDSIHETRVRQIWQELQDQCDWPGPHPEDIPHFSWHVAEAYDEERLTSALQTVSSQLTPFQVIADGLGIFSGEKPVVYINLVKDQVLQQVHQKLWEIFENLGQGISPYYAPHRWIPHITIASGEIEPQVFCCIVQYLAFKPITWTILVDNLVMVGRPDEKNTRSLVHFSLG